MWNRPSERQLSRLPKLYETEHTLTSDKIIHMHFFLGGCDWYAAEFDGKDLFFGYVVLNYDLDNAEWGYFSLTELDFINVGGAEADRELYWTPKPFSQVALMRVW